jgi:hypothetical protein
MQKTVPMALLGVLLAFWIVPASAGRNAGVSVYQYGVVCTTNTVQPGNSFTLVGAGFRTGTPAKICLTGQYPCLVAEVDNSGSFSQAGILYYPGTYQIHVYQMKNRSGGRTDLAWSGELIVVD